MPIERISIAIETDLLAQLDGWVAHRGHHNRSEAIRDLIRARLTTERVEDPERQAIGSLTLLYDHSQRELADRLVETGHEHHHLVVSSMHVHLDRRMCLEVLALRGQVSQLRSLADHLGGLKGIEHYELTLGSPELEEEKD